MKRNACTILASMLLCLAESYAQDGWFWSNPHRITESISGVSFTDANNGTVIGGGGIMRFAKGFGVCLKSSFVKHNKTYI